MSNSSNPPSGGDMLYGVAAIGEFLGLKKRQALYLIESERVPFFRVGKIICARRSSLTQWLAEQEAAASRRATP